MTLFFNDLLILNLISHRQGLKEQAEVAVDQTQSLFDTCIDNVHTENQSKITTNTQTVLDKINSCTSRTVAIESEADVDDDFFQ